MVRASPSDIVIYEYLNFRDTHGRRPSAAELFAAGIGFAPIKEGYESWFHFAAAQGDLGDDEARVLKRHSAWFKDLLRTKMTKAYKMLALRALLDGDALFTGMEVAENARRAFEGVRDDLLLFREMREDEDRRTHGAAFVRSWLKMPLLVWAHGDSTSQSWFRVDGNSFVPSFEIAPEDQEAFEEMTEEMVELRLKQHRDRLLRNSRVDASQAPVVLTVSHSSHRPILRFDRARRPDIPEGPLLVEAGGETYTFMFTKSAVNVATREAGGENVLPQLLRRLLGPSTGQPGIRHHVQLVRDDEVWRLESGVTEPATHESSQVIPFPKLPFYSDVKVACGTFDPIAQVDEGVEQIAVKASVSVDPKRHFVVTAVGDSMNGGNSPIADGDLVLCEWARGVSAESVPGKPFLLVGHDDADTSFAVMKVPRRTSDGWVLESWNPDFAPQPLPAGVKVEPVARVIEVVERATGLVLWGEYDRDVIAKAFGGENNPSWRVGHRDIDVLGAPHTILMITLRKSNQTKVEHRYADRFLSSKELQWESQASTKVDSLKGRRIVGHAKELTIGSISARHHAVTSV